jgi:hypothetical protein
MSHDTTHLCKPPLTCCCEQEQAVAAMWLNETFSRSRCRLPLDSRHRRRHSENGQSEVSHLRSRSLKKVRTSTYAIFCPKSGFWFWLCTNIYLKASVSEFHFVGTCVCMIYAWKTFSVQPSSFLSKAGNYVSCYETTYLHNWVWNYIHTRLWN